MLQINPYKLEVPTTLTLGSVDLLEQLTELREIFYLVDYQFIIKEYDSGIARWMRCIGQGMQKGCGASMLSPSMVLFPDLHMFTNLEVC